MLLGYTAGPYRAKTEWELIMNIRLAEEWAAYGWAQNCAMICPHKNTAHYGGILGLDDSVWLIGDLEMIKRCDFLLIVPGWEKSSGTRGEIALADELGIPVFYMPYDVGKFQDYLEANYGEEE
jgi:hypothetical protein